MLRGLMMEQPLLISSILTFAERQYPRRQIVSLGAARSVHRYDYQMLGKRCRKLARLLAAAGIRRGDRVATLAFNSYRHLEIYYAVSGMGAVCHTINPRLPVEQLQYIINHAHDRWIFVDADLLPLADALAPKLPHLERCVVLGSSLEGAPRQDAYDDLIGAVDDDYEWPVLQESVAASLCYTSGTTGAPKGVLYSHRSTLLHAYASALPDAMGLSALDTVLPVVPMFHVNAWGLPYSSLMVGAKLVFPGVHAGNGEVLLDLVRDERVTFAAGVPTVWQALLDEAGRSGRDLAPLQRVIVGGSACPPFIFNRFRQHGVKTLHAWGMTEMSPVGTVNVATAEIEALCDGERRSLELKQGRALFGVDLRIVDDCGRELPHDGAAAGRLQVRGSCVCAAYFASDDPVSAHGTDGWFTTGDVATIDAYGLLQITDREKDVIKSGGEWISSIDVENAALEHPAVQEAAAVAVPHEKWGERPLLICVLKARQAATREQILEVVARRVPKWWVPNDVQFLDTLPRTSTGKVQKRALRDAFGSHAWPQRGD